ncbi:MAG: DUF4157 domain-containing protein [Flavobacteriales bacterium]|nr:DUF4157 domain-containing protein [Flavobacteriales bacterium]
MGASKAPLASPVERTTHQRTFQPRLKVGAPGDKYEREADAMADRVVSRSPAPSPVTNGGNGIQRQPMEEEEEMMQMQPMEEEEEMMQMKPEEEEETVQMKCAKCEAEEGMMQRQPMEDEEEMMQPKMAEGSTTQPAIQRSENGQHHASSNISNRIAASRGNGQSMPSSVQNEMSAGLGADFSNVNIHTDSTAVQLSSELGAHAFTVGNDVYFNQGKYDPASSGGKHLLAHELTHTIQQGSSEPMVQGDFAVAPTTPGTAVVALTPAQVQAAITFNTARHTDAAEIGLMRDILGLASNPQVIDADFVNALAEYQANYGLPQDGKLGHDTADVLAREMIAEGAFLGPGNQGSLAPEFALQTAIRALITADNRVYADYKAAIQGATMMQQHVALNDQQLLTDLKPKLSWNNWARCIELLGRRAPSGNRMRLNSTVRAAMRAAWTASSPAVTRWSAPDPAHPLNGTCAPIPGAAAPAAHEEGGFIYMNLITGDITTRRVAAGGQAMLPLNAPAAVANSIVVGGFHTHPNVGACWGAPFFSGADTAWSTRNGIPLLMIGAFPAVANTSFHATGSTRAHLAGNRGLPGAAGGLAPQARPNSNDRDEV